MRGPRGERHALMQPKRCVLALRCCQPPASITSCLRQRQFALTQTDQGVTLISKLPGIWRMSVQETNCGELIHQICG
jgi:hypothetical protein